MTSFVYEQTVIQFNSKTKLVSSTRANVSTDHLIDVCLVRISLISKSSCRCKLPLISFTRNQQARHPAEGNTHIKGNIRQIVPEVYQICF